MTAEYKATQWYVATDSQGVLLFLNAEGYATDIPNRAWTGTALEAQQKCAEQNSDKTWRKSGFNWHYAPASTLYERAAEANASQDRWRKLAPKL